MRRGSGYFAAFIVACLALQGCAVPPKRVVDESSRSVPAGRDAIVVVTQAEIRANVKASNVAAATGGGLIPALLDAMITQNRTKEAEGYIRPVREGLGTYDFDQRALHATQDVLRTINWLDVKNVAFTKDGSKDKLLTALDTSTTAQLVVVRYNYALAADFTGLAVSLDVDIYPKDAPAGVSPENRVSSSAALYHESFWYVDKLAEPSDSTEDRKIYLWSANQAQRARAAIDAGLSTVNQLLARSLSQTATAAADLDKGATVKVDTFRGRLVETSNQSTLLFIPETGRWMFLSGFPAPQS